VDDKRQATPADAATAAAGAQATAEGAARALMEGDRASAALGMVLIAVAPGEARLALTVRADMLNGHRVCHGGVIFALADSAFGVACGSRGYKALAAAASIDFLAPGHEGDRLTARARELWLAGRSGIYEVSVINQRDEPIALFRGRSHRVAGRLVE
jgi:acyl-CoA thioesterase